VNHIATGRALSPGGQLLPPHHGRQQRDGDGSEVDGDGGGGNGVDGDGSRGTSPSRQGARTETSVPQNSSVAAAELQNSFSKNTD
jgi:hypothetical protein